MYRIFIYTDTYTFYLPLVPKSTIHFTSTYYDRSQVNFKNSHCLKHNKTKIKYQIPSTTVLVQDRPLLKLASVEMVGWLEIKNNKLLVNRSIHTRPLPIVIDTYFIFEL